MKSLRLSLRHLIVVSLCVFFLSSCSTTEYLWQAGRGQFALVNRARPLVEVIRDEKTSPRVRELLQEVPRIKAFGEKMGLKATRSYEAYVHLDRDAVVTVVSACEPLRFEPKEWKFPIVGGFPYLGFYDAKDAHKYGSKLRAEGFDVDVRGAPAYSTLGWFKDPILSTMIPAGEGAIGELVEVIMHESLHATAYVNHQAFFNESVASFVSEKLTPLYFQETRGKNSVEERKYRENLSWQEVRLKRMHETYLELDRLYESALPDPVKLAQKEATIAKLKKDLKWREGRDLNNATLLGFREYSGNREVFESLFKKCGEDWSKFLAALKALRGEDFGESQTNDLTSLTTHFRCVKTP